MDEATPKRGGRRFCRRHRSLRRRLVWAFVRVSFVTLIVAFAAMRASWFHGGGHYGSNYRVGFVALAVAALTGVFIARRITGRLNRLEEAVERLDLRDLSLRVPVEGDDEVATLARAFNRMVERLEAEERVRRQLFADVAHELRHPLAVLKGRLEMMQDGVTPLNPEQILHLQDMVITLTRLVGDLRDLSLAEVGQLSLDLAPLDLGELIADLRENLDPVATDKRIRLHADVPRDLPRVTADGDRIRQVLVNLLSNAIHYTPEGGKVEVKARFDPDKVIIEISDTGPGIAPEDHPHIFDRFYRTDKARSRASGGSGLGLAIVRSLVMLHGGSVGAESGPGEGSRFILTLPRTRS